MNQPIELKLSISSNFNDEIQKLERVMELLTEIKSLRDDMFGSDITGEKEKADKEVQVQCRKNGEYLKKSIDSAICDTFL